MFKIVYALMASMVLLSTQAFAQHDQYGEANSAKVGRFTCTVTEVKDSENTELQSLGLPAQVGQRFFAEVYDNQSMGNGPIQQILMLKGTASLAKTYNSNPSSSRGFVIFGEHSRRFEVGFAGAQGASSITSQKGTTGWDAFQSKVLINFTCTNGIY